ncbi:hypothetical protein [Niastella populi]|uniref:Uncharacterized protein n=1 Tax=Niastella populi TaxID=550983 RepID=A0A1V9FEI7_9BACT|nr:hypothetical protein [Niastella populi]OQP56691.1 hypothetical protein A4R26_25705 [Niastella populi]
MKKFLFLLILLCIEISLHAQYVYTIKADSVKITNTCDTAELIIENHTQNVCGFLFNKGKGRTEFRRGLLRINDSISVIGCDTLKLNPWLQGGNRFGTTGKFGTLDDNPIDYYTNNTLRGRWATNGNLTLGSAIDEGHKFQVMGSGGVFINPNLSRQGDRIIIGSNINTSDGQNILIATSNNYGGSYKNVLVERDGNIGLGHSAPHTWSVGAPLIRCHASGLLSIMTPGIYFGNTPGPWNASALVTAVSNTNEWLTGQTEYPRGANHYYFGTRLTTSFDGATRAPLKISGRELYLQTGPVEATAIKIAENRNVMIGTETDNGDKLQVIGNVFANGAKHLLGNLSIVNGTEAAVAGSAAGIRVDDPTNGSFIFQGTNQGWARDMFVFTDTYNGLGQDVYFDDQSIIKIKNGIRSNNIAGNSASMINIQPVYNLNPAVSNPLTMRGIYYKPILTSIVPGSKHVAIETVSGDVLLGTTSGNTGIGTSAPTAQLHTTSTVRFGGLTNNNSLSRVVVSDANGNLYYREDSSFGAFNGSFDSDLAVNGRVSAKQMLLTQTGHWPDYVFDKQYKLPSLTEGENFINKHSHLPGIPSAAEVEQKGIDVGGNQAALLKKIEELTLYIIEQDKTIKKQNDQINDLLNLKQEMAELKALIKSK